MNQVLLDRECPVCGTVKCVSGAWKFKRRVKEDGKRVTKYYCSYTCFNKGQQGVRKDAE